MIKALSALLLFISYFPFCATAVLQIDIVRGNAAKIPISVMGCGVNESIDGIVNITKNDLMSSSVFEVKSVDWFLCDDDLSTSEIKDIPKNAMLLIIRMAGTSKDDVEVKMRLLDPSMRKQLLGKSLSAGKANYRSVGHMIADSVYSKVTGEKGYFNTKIAYVANHDGVKKIAIIDHDGANNQFLTDGKVVVATPRFSPENDRIVYMSYLNKMGKVYMKNLNGNTDKMVTNFSGTISAPRFSPDGKRIVMARSHGNITDIYTINLLKNKDHKRLTVRSAINTSASYSPDQKKMVFNSDRGGSPQIYVMNADGSNQNRISFGNGNYLNPVWSPRGDLIAFTKIHRRTFYIGVMRPDGRDERIITTGYLVEGPSWSPSGRLMLFTREEPNLNRRGKEIVSKIYSIDITGKNERIIHTPHSAAAPSWSDLLR